LSDDIKMGFELEGLTIPLDRILPVKQIHKSVRKSKKYLSIKASIEEVGIIEPPIVYPEKKKGRKANRKYLLLDGHVRIDILKKMGQKEVFCLISTDDEGYTYNHKVNRLSPIQEHYMIMRGIKNGIAEERIAKALNVDVSRIRQNQSLLTGICREAVDLLKDKQISGTTLKILKKVKDVRQIEMAELMNSVNNYTRPYALALIASTPKELFVENNHKKEKMGAKPEDIARMEKEMKSLERDFKMIEENYGENVLNLVLARGYLTKLLDNARVIRFLSNHHGEILSEFQKIIESSSLEN